MKVKAVPLDINKRRRQYHLEETAVLEVVFDDDIGDSIEDELHIVGVCGACEVCVDLLRIFLFVEILKLHLNVGCRLFIRV